MTSSRLSVLRRGRSPLAIVAILVWCVALFGAGTLVNDRTIAQSLASEVETAPPALIRIDRDRLVGNNLGEFEPYDPENSDILARDHEYFYTADRNFGVGLWESKPGTLNYTDVGLDELMFVLDGGMTMTDADGASETFGPGEGLVLPRGWTGSMIVPDEGVRMIWASYEAMVEAAPAPIIRVDRDRLAGNDLGEFEPYEPEIGDLMARGYEYFYSEDGDFGTGVWESKPGMQTYTSLGYDELMYVLEGALVMTDAAGKVETFGPGEGLVLPKGWSGTLTVPEGGVRKIWAAYMGGKKG